MLIARSTHRMLQSKFIFFLFDFLNNIVAELSLYYNTLVRDLQDRKRFRRILGSPITGVILFVVVAMLAKSDYNIYKTNQIARINREESDRRLLLLQEKHDRLSLELQKLKTARGIEEELRNKFQVTKSGEEVLVVLDEDIPKPPIEADKGYWQKFIDFFNF